MARIVVCIRCDRERPHEAHGFCSGCYSTYRRALDPEKARAYDKVIAARRPDHDRTFYASKPWEYRVKFRASAKAARKTLDQEFLKRLREENPNCMCCDKQLDYAAGNHVTCRTGNKATLDKVVPVLGYVNSNVGILCWECNLKKQDCTAADLERLLAYVEGHAAKAA